MLNLENGNEIYWVMFLVSRLRKPDMEEDCELARILDDEALHSEAPAGSFSRHVCYLAEIVREHPSHYRIG